MAYAGLYKPQGRSRRSRDGEKSCCSVAQVAEPKFWIQVSFEDDIVDIIYIVDIVGFLVGKEDTLAEASNILSACLFP